MNSHILPIVLGKYSPSQNRRTKQEQSKLACYALQEGGRPIGQRIIVSAKGIALCIAGGGKGHDTDKPKILIEYD